MKNWQLLALASGLCGSPFGGSANAAELAFLPATPQSEVPASLSRCGQSAAIEINGTCWQISGSLETMFLLDHGTADLKATPLYAADLPIIAYEVVPARQPSTTGFRTETFMKVASLSQTEFGPLETLIAVKSVTSTDGDTTTKTDQAFVRFAGFTAGLTTSLFDFGSGYTWSAGFASDTKAAQLSYQARLGEGASLAVGIEDALAHRAPENVWANYEGAALPDLVTRLRVEGSLGTFQAMAAARELSSESDGVSGIAGWALGTGIELNAGTWIPGAKLMATGTIASGGLSYTGSSDFATDFFVDEGAVSPTRSTSLLASVFVPLGSTFAAAVTASWHGADTKGPTQHWQTQSLKGSATLSWSPTDGFLAGLDVAVYRDSARSTLAGVANPELAAERLEITAFAKRVF